MRWFSGQEKALAEAAFCTADETNRAMIICKTQQIVRYSSDVPCKKVGLPAALGNGSHGFSQLTLSRTIDEEWILYTTKKL